MNDIQERFHALKKELEQFYSNWGINSISIVNHGVESAVFKVESHVQGVMAIKVPWQRFISNDNDRCDTRDLLSQESYLTTYLSERGIKVPRPIQLHCNDEGVDFLATEYILHDKSDPDSYEFGKLIRSIHDCYQVNRTLVMETETNLNVILSERIANRARSVEHLTNVDFGHLTVFRLMKEFESFHGENFLLHMDARPANIFTDKGHILAISDWSNALHGDPSLEIARIAEYGYVNEEFFAGYGCDPFTSVPKSVELLYRLDTTIMLCVVFLSLAPDKNLSDSYIQRSQKLYTELVQNLAS